jgi:hypothetical protein
MPSQDGSELIRYLQSASVHKKRKEKERKGKGTTSYIIANYAVGVGRYQGELGTTYSSPVGLALEDDLLVCLEQATSQCFITRRLCYLFRYEFHRRMRQIRAEYT